MHLPMKRRRQLAWRHWETWTSVLPCGLAAVLGGWLGQQLLHPHLGGIVGGAIGGALFSRARNHAIRRHHADGTGPR